MKKRLIRLLTVAMICVMMTSVMAVGVSADTWYINHIPGAPSSISNTTDFCYVPYAAQGFKATCSTLTGPIDKAIEITAVSNGGINVPTNGVVTMTSTGTYPTAIEVALFSNGNVTFRVYLRSNITGVRSSTGSIIQAQI
jgi:hypothetical protein